MVTLRARDALVMTHCLEGPLPWVRGLDKPQGRWGGATPSAPLQGFQGTRGARGAGGQRGPPGAVGLTVSPLPSYQPDGKGGSQGRGEQM